MKEFTLDLQRMTVVDPNKGIPVLPGPRRAVSSTDRDLIDGALGFGKPFNPGLGGAQEVVGVSKSPPTVIVRPSPTVPMFSRGGKTGLTVALGVTLSAGLVGGVSLAAGVYGSTTREFGVFGTGGFVVGVVSGGALGNELTFIFGGPGDFSGVFVAIAASISFPIPVFSGGASLIFSPGPMTPGGFVSLVFMGFSFRASVGFSALPFSATIEWTNTAIKPLIKL